MTMSLGAVAVMAPLRVPSALSVATRLLASMYRPMPPSVAPEPPFRRISPVAAMLPPRVTVAPATPSVALTPSRSQSEAVTVTTPWSALATMAPFSIRAPACSVPITVTRGAVRLMADALSRDTRLTPAFTRMASVAVSASRLPASTVAPRWLATVPLTGVPKVIVAACISSVATRKAAS